MHFRAQFVNQIYFRHYGIILCIDLITLNKKLIIFYNFGREIVYVQHKEIEKSRVVYTPMCVHLQYRMNDTLTYQTFEQNFLIC